MNIKSRLESTLDDLEASHEKGKRIRANVESEGRKVEGELKMTQESVADLERSKKEMEALIMRKDLAVQALSSKLEDEQGCVGRVQKESGRTSQGSRKWRRSLRQRDKLQLNR